METVSDFIFAGSKISADGDCSHEIIGIYYYCHPNRNADSGYDFGTQEEVRIRGRDRI